MFKLKVTDAAGLFSKDTFKVTVNTVVVASCGDTNRPHVIARLVPVGTLSQARVGMSVATAGNKILFAGGGQSPTVSSRVDLYDLNTTNRQLLNSVPPVI